jgi:hypothetical protein
MQGVFLKKQKVPNGRGGFLEPSDFQLGRDITIFSHTFHIVGCDVFTKVTPYHSLAIFVFGFHFHYFNWVWFKFLFIKF